MHQCVATIAIISKLSKDFQEERNTLSSTVHFPLRSAFRREAAKMTSLNAILLTICLLSCIENQFATSYITPASHRWNQIRANAYQQKLFLQTELSADRKNDFSESLVGHFVAIRARILPALLLSTLVFGICEITLPGEVIPIGPVVNMKQTGTRN